jgi:hypothetical protein
MVDEAEDFGRIGDRCACGGAVMHARDKGVCHDCQHRNALTAARAEGYAEGRAAERADMLAFVEDACRLGTQGDALLRALMAKGKHDGAAAIWHGKGYADAVADVVAWLRARADGLRSHTYGQDDERTVLERVVDGIEDACHVGAAKKGGE